MRHEEDEEEPLCPICAPDADMTPLPEDEAGWDGPDPEPAEPDEDLGAGLKGRLGGANVLTGILTLDAALDNHVMSNALGRIPSDFSGALKTLLYVVSKFK